ncbi:DUF2254 domain-containing protein [Gordonia sinesedis]
MQASPTSEPRHDPPVSRETIADRWRWYRVRRHLRVKTVWGLPLRLMVVIAAAGVVMPLLDRAFANVLQPYPSLDSGAIASILGIISGASLTLAGLVFTALTTAMSHAVSSLSIRVSPIFRQDRVVRVAQGIFLGTFWYALLISLSIAAGEDAYQPFLGTMGAIVLVGASGIALLALIHRVLGDIDPGGLLNRIAAIGYRGEGRQVTDYHDRQPAKPRHGLDATYVVTRTEPVAHGDTLLAVNSRRLLAFEHDSGITVDLAPRAGSAVAIDEPLFYTSAAVSDRQAKLLRSATAFGDTYSPAAGPFAAIRTMVDIALKALSPAINDPTRAVQVLDAVEDVLADIVPRVADDEAALAGDANQTLLRGDLHTWPELVSAATDEIREFGTTSVQIQRRLRALFANLIVITAPAQHPPLTDRLDALDRGVDQWWDDPLDRALARQPDPQGFGGAERAAAARPATRKPTADG